MKKILLTLLLPFFFLVNIFSQNLEWNRQPSPYASANCILPLEDGSWIIGGTVGEYYLVAIDSLGNTIWGDVGIESSFNPNYVEEMFFDSDTSFYIVGGRFPRVESNFRIEGDRIIRRYSTAGRLLNDFSDFVDLDTGDFTSFKTADLFSNQSIIIVAEDNRFSTEPIAEIIIFNSEDSTEWIQEFENIIFHDVKAYDDGSFNVAASKGVLHFDENKNNTHTVLENEVVYQIEAFQNDFTLALTKDKLYLLDDDLQTSNVYASMELDSIVHFFVDENEIVLTGKNHSGLPFVLRLDESLEQQSYFTFGNTAVFPNAVIVKENAIGVLGETVTNPFKTNLHGWKYTSMFFKTFTKDGISTSYNEDVGLVDFEIGSAEATLIENIYSPHDDEYYDLSLKNINITIENLGEDTLSELKVNLLENSFAVTKKLFNLQIPPSESLRVSFGRLDWWGRLIDQDTEFELCIWTSVPDGKIDINPSNDRFCKTIVFKIKEPDTTPQLVELPAILFPNPATDFVNVNLLFSDGIGYDIIVTNAIGQTVFKTKVDAIPHRLTTIDISKFAKGTYFVICQNKEEQLVFPFVKM